MTTLVIGANGQIGRQFCELARAAGEPIKASGVPWTILKLGRLIDESATRRIATSLAETGGTNTVSRANVAEALLHLVQAHDLAGREFHLLDGEREIAEALS